MIECWATAGLRCYRNRLCIIIIIIVILVFVVVVVIAVAQWRIPGAEFGGRTIFSRTKISE